MKKIILFLIFHTFCWAQKINSLENTIYQSIDKFVEKPSLSAVSILAKTETEFYNLSRPKSKDEYLALVILKCNKAYYLNTYGKSNWAIKEYEIAYQIFKQNKLSNYDIIEYCLKPLGNLYTIKGDYLSAENTIKEYYYLANKKPKNPENNSHILSALLNLSAVYQSSGKHSQAINLIETTLLNEDISALQKARFYNNLGNSYLALHNFDKAEKSFKRSISLLEKKNTKSFREISNAFKNLAHLYQQQNKFTLAEEALAQSTHNLFKVSNISIRELSKLEFAKASMYFQSGDTENCHRSINKILKALIPNYYVNKLPLKKQLYQETILIDALDLKAKLYTLTNESKRALEAYSLSFYIEDLLENDVFYEESRIAFQIKNRSRVENCLLLLYHLFQKEKNEKYLFEAFKLKEKYNSGVLNFMLSKISNSGAKEKKLIEKIQQLNTVITKEQLKLEQADIVKINTAIQLQNETMLELKKTHKIDSKQDINIDLLFKNLKKSKTELISYFYGSEAIFMFHFKNNKIDFHMFKEYEKLNLAIRKLTSFFSSSEKINTDVEAFKKASFEVYRKLCLDQITNTKNIVIIPDGALLYVPFESLITQQSITRNFAKMPFLIFKTKITYCNSASFYLNSVKKQNINAKKIIGLFPIFKNTSYSLPFSKKEFEYLSKNFDGKYFIGEKATFSNFIKNNKDFDIIHLSTHASSGDIYEPAQIKFIEQDVTFNEFYPIKTNADLVVLSACETGIGKRYQGEGFMSIARGFQMGGTKNLVFSLWKVNDYTTFKIIQNFYAHIKQNESYSLSLNKAKIDYLRDNAIPNAKKSPYYWSSLIYYGTIEKNYSINYWNILLFMVVVLAIIAFFLKKKNVYK